MALPSPSAVIMALPSPSAVTMALPSTSAVTMALPSPTAALATSVNVPSLLGSTSYIASGLDELSPRSIRRGAIAPASVEGSDTEISGISSASEGKRYGVVALDPFGASYEVVSEI
ncbi:hypothetical protein EV121DRAFT_293216 [Schizophyllum commune]